MKQQGRKIIEDIALRMMRSEIPERELIARIEAEATDLANTDRDGRTLLINAAFYGRYEIARWLLANGADINAQDHHGYTALHAAVQERKLDVILLLLRHGADVNAKDAFGNNPIMRTNQATPTEILRILLRNGADPDQKNNFGVSYCDTNLAYPELLRLIEEERR